MRRHVFQQACLVVPGFVGRDQQPWPLFVRECTDKRNVLNFCERQEDRQHTEKQFKIVEFSAFTQILRLIHRKGSRGIQPWMTSVVFTVGEVIS